jgi:hypothetical protein
MTDDMIVRLRGIRAGLRREGLGSVGAYRLAAPELLSRLDPADRAFIEWAIRDGQAEVLAVLFSPSRASPGRRRVARGATPRYVIGLALAALLIIAAALVPLAAMLAVAGWLR